LRKGRSGFIGRLQPADAMPCVIAGTEILDEIGAARAHGVNPREMALRLGATGCGQVDGDGMVVYRR
jgi:hypothetical protein